jgi:dTDP-D-glucose 4,6-dehydratase
MTDKPRVLVLGGVGFIGRNFVEYLAKNQLCSKIAVCDKVLPETAGLSNEQLKLFKREDLVVYKQINLAREGIYITTSNF